MNDNLFPSIQKTIDSFIQDEEGSIPHGKLVTLGAFFLIMSSYIAAAGFGHSSHKSHKSHSSHSSHSSGSHSNGSHRSHASHVSHSSGYSPHNSHSSYKTPVPHNSHSSHYSYSTPVPHSSHGSHTSHSNTSAHSNSQYSSAGDLASYIAAPASSVIKGIDKFFEFADNLPDTDSGVSVIVENPDLGRLKAAAAPKSIMDITKPGLQSPNDSLSIPAITPTMQDIPGAKDIKPDIEGNLE